MILTSTHFKLLHAALGLSYYVFHPTRNWLPDADVQAHPGEVADLVAAGLLVMAVSHGEGGTSYHYEITAAGREIALANRPEHHNPLTTTTKTETKKMTAATTARAPRTKKTAEAAPAPDTRTGDLLAAAAPPFDTSSELAPAAPQAAAQVALATIKPEEYVAQVYQPFLAKFDQYRAEANGVVFAHDAEAMAWLEGLPEAERACYKVVDITTTAGMAIAVQHRARFRDEVRLDSEKAHKKHKAPVLDIGRLLDAKKKEIAEQVEPFETRFDAAIKAEERRKEEEKAAREAAEAARVAAIREKISDITVLAQQHANADSATLTAVLTELAEREATKEEFAELLDEAALAIETTASALIALLQGAQAREQAEAERIRLAEEEKARIAAQAEANRIEAERLAAERAKAEQAAQEAAAAAAALKLAQDQQHATMEAVNGLNELAAVEGDARALCEALAGARALQLDDARFGSGAGMVQMAHRMAVKTLEQRLALVLGEELPAAHAEALEMNAGFDFARQFPENGGYVAFAHSDGAVSVYPVEPAPEPDPELSAESAPEPAPLPEPEAYSAIDEQINLGALTDRCLTEGPSDREIVDLVAMEYGMTFADALERMAVIAFAELRAA